MARLQPPTGREGAMVDVSTVVRTHRRPARAATIAAVVAGIALGVSALGVQEQLRHGPDGEHAKLIKIEEPTTGSPPAPPPPPQ